MKEVLQKMKKKVTCHRRLWLFAMLCLICFSFTRVQAAPSPMLKPRAKVIQSASAVKITWPVQKDVSGYRVYRKNGRSEKWTLLKTVKNLRGFYVDKKTEAGKTYYYTVRAYRSPNPAQGIKKTQYGPYYGVGFPITLKDTRSKWQKFLDQYQKDSEVKQLVFVKCTGGSNANVEMYTKKSAGWSKLLDCQGYIGSNGPGKVKEGDRKTPIGTFNLTQAFGIKEDPGAKTDYLKVTKYHYWCGDPSYYNQLIDVRQKPHTCHGEHLIDYVPSYHYGMFLDYNPKNIVGKGSAIFLHCFSGNPYTGGCIAVSETNMIKIIRNAEKGAKILIYEE